MGRIKDTLDLVMGVISNISKLNLVLLNILMHLRM